MKKVFLYAIIFFQVLLIVSLVKGLQISMRSQQRISALEATKRGLEEERQKLLKQLQYVQSDYYMEQVARDQLHLSKPGETVILVPEGAVASTSAQKEQALGGEVPNWQKWWRVITGLE